MTVAADYGVALSWNGSAVIQVTNIPIPAITQVMAEFTNHSSSGWREFVAGRLRTLEAFTITIAYDLADTVHIAMITDQGTGTARTAIITFTDAGNATWSFSALIEKFATQPQDAQNPRVISAQVTLRPTGTMTITP